MKNTIIYVFIIIIVLVIFMLYDVKNIFYIAVNYYITPLIYNQNKYFLENFDQIIKPYYRNDVTYNNGSININSEAKNEYCLLKDVYDKDFIRELQSGSKDAINNAFKKIIGHIKINGKPVEPNDFILLNSVNIEGSYFPYFHTDSEWATFCENDGFQVWILLQEDTNIAPRGNMFIMKTNEVQPHTSIKIHEKGVDLVSNIFNSSEHIIKSYSSLNDLHPEIEYIKCNIGDAFIMNKNVYHCSDPVGIGSNRKAINFRLIYKPNDKMKLCNKNTFYTQSFINLRYDKNVECFDDYCYLNETNDTLKYKFI